MTRWSLLLLVFTAAAAGADRDEGFRKLFNGKDLADWKFLLKTPSADPADTWSVQDGVIICTGKPNGFFYTDKSYRNYVIRYSWRYLQPRPGQKSSFNSGLLLHIQSPPKYWPRSIEIQGSLKDNGQLHPQDCQIIDSHYDRTAKERALHPVGEWNTTEVVCKPDGSLRVVLNGTEVASGKTDLTEGRIGFQSEGAEIHFREILIKKLK